MTLRKDVANICFNDNNRFGPVAEHGKHALLSKRDSRPCRTDEVNSSDHPRVRHNGSGTRIGPFRESIGLVGGKFGGIAFA